MSASQTSSWTEAPRELVLASAGTGKTYRITSRLISLLAHGADPDHLLASSFTRKAAGEILQRTLDRLAEAATDPAAAVKLSDAAALNGAPALPTSTDFWADVLERAVRRLHRLDIGTLDSFFIRAAGAFQQELGLPPAWGIVDEPGAQRLRSEVLQEVLARMDRTELIELLRLVNRGAVRRSVHDHLLDQLDELLAVQWQLDPAATDPWGAFASGGGAGGGEPPEARRIGWADALDRAPVPQTRAGTPDRTWEKALRAAAAALRVADWEAFAGLGLCQKVLVGESAFNRRPLHDVLPLLQPALAAAREALRGRYAQQVEALGRLVGRFEEGLIARQAATGDFRFEEVTRLLGGADPLAKRADLFYRLDARTRHILLDEFQDTSLPQWEALEPLVDEVLSDEGRAGVIVADPKQSIYGWRGAEPGIVHMVGARYRLDRAELSASRRSSDVVLGLVNQVFSRIDELPSLRKQRTCHEAAEEWRRDFTRHVSALEGLPGYARVEVGPRDEGRGSLRPLLCGRAADLVGDLRAAAPGFNIGVLTRTNRTVAQMILELRERGLTPSEEGGNPLTDSGACEAVLALLRLADHPGDGIAGYHVAKSALGPLIGFTNHTDPNRALALGHEVRMALLARGYGAWLNDLAHRMAEGCDARELRRLLQLVELGFRYDTESTLRPGDFVRLVESQRVEDPTRADIRVMTVHQSKGLEFDLVVLPELDASLYRPPRAPVFPFRPAAGQRVQAVLPAIPAGLRCLYPEVEAAYGQAEAAAVRDGLSTLYVALTRARHAVHVLIAPDGEKGPGSAVTPARLLRESLEPGEERPRQVAEGDVLYEKGDPAWHLRVATPAAAPPVDEEPPRRPIRLAHSSRSRLIRRSTPSQMEGGSRVDLGLLLRLDHGAAMSRGTLVHAWFEQIRWADEPLPDPDGLRRIARLHDPELAGDSIERLLGEFHGWLANPAIRSALSRSSYAHEAEVRNESRFLHREEGTLVEGSIDRLILLRSGGRVVGAEVMDYKTDRFGGDEAVLAERVEHYRPQLLAYARAVRAAYRLQEQAVLARIVLLDPGRVVDIGIPTVTGASPPPTINIRQQEETR